MGAGLHPVSHQCAERPPNYIVELLSPEAFGRRIDKCDDLIAVHGDQRIEDLFKNMMIVTVN